MDFMTTEQKPSKKEILANRSSLLAEGKSVRELSVYERSIWGGTLMAINYHVPFVSHMVSILSPFVDLNSNTTYVDPHCRMGVHLEFFYTATLNERIMCILHEAMHISNQHFNRADYLKMTPHELNVCGDLEINTNLQRIKRLEEAVKIGLLPETFNFPKGQTMEIYKTLFDEAKNQNDDSHTANNRQQGNNSQESSNDADSREQELSNNLDQDSLQDCNHNTNCSYCDSTKIAQADSLGVPTTSDTAILDARQNIKVALKDFLEKQSGYGNFGHDDITMFAKELLAQISNKSKVPWQYILRKVLASSYNNACRGTRHRSFRRVNKRFSTKSVILPGSVDYIPTVMFAVDTSGSMGESDYQKLLTEIETVIKKIVKGSNKLQVFSVDTEVGDIQTVSSISQLKLTGGGGTDMSVAFNKVAKMPKKLQPDIFVVATDGQFPWDEKFVKSVYSIHGKSIILVTDEYGWDCAKEFRNAHPDVEVINIAKE